MRRQRNLLGPQGMGGMVSLWGASSMVNSIQYGQIELYGVSSSTATITSVNTANAMLVFLGESSTDQNTAYIGAVRMTLTNATTVTARRDTSQVNGLIIRFAVIEYAPGVVRSIQYGLVSVNPSAASGTATITSVNTAKSYVAWLGKESQSGIGGASGMFSMCTLTNATTVTANTGNGEVCFTSFIVVESF